MLTKLIDAVELVGRLFIQRDKTDGQLRVNVVPVSLFFYTLTLGGCAAIEPDNFSQCVKTLLQVLNNE